MIKNGKLFGKFNLFDIAILILVVALIGFGAIKYKTLDKTVDTSAGGNIVYTMTILGVRDYTIDAFAIGDLVFDSGTNVNIGKIQNIESRPSKLVRVLKDGSAKVVENEFRKDMILTIETAGSSTNEGYYANRSIELKVGSEKEIETKYAKTNGKISSITYNEKGE